MGSFNVACSISRISIGRGDKVVFIPLVASTTNKNNMLSIPRQFVVNPNDFFNPLCLPIRGEYNDYGNIENVIRDDNLDLIENFLGFSIEELIDYIHSKDIYNYLSNLSAKFLPRVDILKDASPINSSFLKNFGFIKIGEFKKSNIVEEVYEYGDVILPFFINLCKETLSITDDTGKILSKFNIPNGNISQQYKSILLKTFANISKYYVGVEKKYQGILNLIDRMSGMFINSEIYDALTIKKHNDYEDYIGSYADHFDEYIELVRKLNSIVEKDTFLNLSIKKSYLPFVEQHKYWYRFKDIFDGALLEGKLRKDFIKYNIFETNMYSMNCFYFPAMSGEQYGNDEASLAFAETVVKVIKNNIKKYKED